MGVAVMLSASPAVYAAVSASEPSLPAAYDHGRDKGRAPGTRGPLPQGFSTTELSVKFKPDRRIQIRNHRASAANTGDASALNAVLSKYPDAGVLPLTGRSPSEVVEERVRLEKKIRRRLPDLTSWYTITVSRGIERLLADLNRLPSVEIAQATPIPVAAAEPLQSKQVYRNPAGAGVDADAAASVPGGKGDGVLVSDLEGGLPRWVGTSAAAGTLAAGDEHTLIVDRKYFWDQDPNWKSSVWAWGGNGQGQLGDGTTTDKTKMVKVPGLSDVKAVAAGGDFSLALKADGTMWSWGGNDQGQLGDGTTIARRTPVQVSGITDVVGISAGSDGHALAVLADGTVKAWGNNDEGQLGDGTTGDRSTPITVLTGAVAKFGAVAAGGGHSIAVLADGTVRAWGNNDNGQLGNGSTTDSDSPVQTGGLSGVTQVGAGRLHSLAVRLDGTVRAWGDNSRGQLGDGTTADSGTPVQPSGLVSVTNVAAGGFHNVAAVSSERWAWGANDDGRVGDGTTIDRHAPVEIASTGAGTVPAAGLRHSFAAGPSTPMRLWGANDKGQLGTGDTIGSLTPVTPVTGLAMADLCHEDLAGRTSPGGPIASLGPIVDECQHSAVAHGTAVAGIIGARNDNGKGVAGMAPHARLRIDPFSSTVLAATIENSVPGDVILYEAQESIGGKYYPIEGAATYYDLTVLATASGITVVEAAGNGTVDLDDPQDPHSAAIMTRPDSGAIMVGAGAPPAVDGSDCLESPQAERTALPFTNYGSRVDVQAYGRCIWTTTSRADKHHPSNETDLNKTYTYDFGGTSGASAITAGAVASLQGAAKRMGGPLSPQLVRHVLKVTGTPQPASDPRHIGPSPNVRRAIEFLRGGVAAGGGWTLVAGNDGKVRSWGVNFEGQLGDGTTTGRNGLAEVAGLSGVVRSPRAVAGGEGHSLAVRSDGTVWAWGDNSEGQLGDSTTTDRSTPTQVPGLSGVTAVAAGGYWSLALKSDGTLWAWGSGQSGQLGSGEQEGRTSPVQVGGLSGVVDMAAAWNHGLAVKSDGTLWAWGDNTEGQLGDGSTDTRLTPVQVAGIGGVSTWAGSVAAGDGHSLAVKSDGTVAAWGRNDLGQLGIGSTGPDIMTPRIVSGLTEVFGVGAGASHSFAVRHNRTTFAWGYNALGQVGIGSAGGNVLTPSLIGALTGATAVAGGSNHSAATLFNGTVYTWGDGGSGQLGHGNNNSLNIPTRVNGTP
ncbi:S8 family serine peptidase [Thermomonospora umbrina]|nr:S8 family serine peptidase [Thermomonospora umbrina]